MPGFNPSALGDWIQIAASVGVIGGFVLLIVELADMGLLFKSEQTDRAFDAPAATPHVHLGEDPLGVTRERQSELRHFVRQNCGACHGETGGIGPALSEATLEHLSVNGIAFTILYGRPAKGMPPWDPQLSAEDAYWIAEILKREDGI